MVTIVNFPNKKRILYDFISSHFLSHGFSPSPSHAQNSPQDYVNAHNAARANVGVGPVTWDERVADYARSYANKRSGDCNLIHSPNSLYSENIAWGSTDLSGTDAVNLWVSEKPYYDYNSNTFAERKVCGHYTQVVWRKSVRIGCAKVSCKTGGTLISCIYDPPVNYAGERPYKLIY